MWEHIKNFWAEIWRNKMGGDNQSTLAPDKKSDPEQKTEILSMADAVDFKKDKKDKKDKKKKKKDKGISQEIRQHVSGTECHWHVDAEDLKVAIPVAEWVGITQRLMRMETVEYIDVVNSTHVTFEPFLKDNVLDISIRVIDIKLSDHFDKVINLKR